MSTRTPDSIAPIQSDGLSWPALLTVSIVLVTIWGGAYTMVGVGVDYMSPINLVAYRLVIGAVLVTGYAYSIGQRFPKLSDQRWRWYYGVCPAVLFALYGASHGR